MEYKKIDLVTENEFNDFDREESKKYVVNWFMNESKNPYLLKDDSAMAYKLAYYILKDEDEISPYSADSIIFNFWITMYHSDINKKELNKYREMFMLNQYCKYGLIKED